MTLDTQELFKILRDCTWKPENVDHNNAIREVVNKIANALQDKCIFFDRNGFVSALGFVPDKSYTYKGKL